MYFDLCQLGLFRYASVPDFGTTIIEPREIPLLAKSVKGWTICPMSNQAPFPKNDLSQIAPICLWQLRRSHLIDKFGARVDKNLTNKD